MVEGNQTEEEQKSEGGGLQNSGDGGVGAQSSPSGGAGQKGASNQLDRVVREACAQYAKIDLARKYVWDWFSKNPDVQKALAEELINQAILSRIYNERSRIRRELRNGAIDSVKDSIPTHNASGATRNILNEVHKQHILETWPTEFGLWLGELTMGELEVLRDRERRAEDGHGAKADLYDALIARLPDRTTRVKEVVSAQEMAQLTAAAYGNRGIR